MRCAHLLLTSQSLIVSPAPLPVTSSASHCKRAAVTALLVVVLPIPISPVARVRNLFLAILYQLIPVTMAGQSLPPSSSVLSKNFLFRSTLRSRRREWIPHYLFRCPRDRLGTDALRHLQTEDPSGHGLCHRQRDLLPVWSRLPHDAVVCTEDQHTFFRRSICSVPV